MNFTRFSLYSALAIVTYLMLLAWQEDYPPNVSDNSTAVETPNPDVDPNTLFDVPSTLPTQPPISGVEVGGASLPTARPSESISVSTDTLELTISLIGGDITSLALPQFPKQLNVPSDPFDLLQTQPSRNYVAQSGLVGRDGIDNEDRARYQSQQNRYVLGDTEEQLTIDLLTQVGETNIIKRYRFTRGSYLVKVSFIITNLNDNSFQANAFGQIKRDVFEDSSGLAFGRTYLGFVTTSVDDPYIRIDLMMSMMVRRPLIPKGVGSVSASITSSQPGSPIRARQTGIPLERATTANTSVGLRVALS